MSGKHSAPKRYTGTLGIVPSRILFEYYCLTFVLLTNIPFFYYQLAIPWIISDNTSLFIGLAINLVQPALRAAFLSFSDV